MNIYRSTRDNKKSKRTANTVKTVYLVSKNTYYIQFVAEDDDLNYSFYLQRH
jgi:hypothetical protein